MSNMSIRYKFLNPIFFVKGFVKDDPLCNYEIVLRELINSSNRFIALSQGERYVAPPSESHGEYDANTEKYSIDFKLAESKTVMEAKHLYSNSIYIIGDGVTCYGPSDHKGETLGVLLHVALRDISSYRHIDEIINGSYKYIKKEKRNLDNFDESELCDLQSYFKMLLTKKNLLLFIPKEFIIEDHSYNDYEMILEALSSDYSLSLNYRFDRIQDKDTYLSCCYEEKLLLFEFSDYKLHFVEDIDLSNSDTYNYLKNRYDIFS